MKLLKIIIKVAREIVQIIILGREIKDGLKSFKKTGKKE